MIESRPTHQTHLGSSTAFQASYRILSFDFRLETDEVEAGIMLHRFLTGFARQSPNGTDAIYRIVRDDRETPFSLYRDDELVYRGSTPWGLIDHILWDSNQEAVSRTDHHFAIHASAASGNGLGFVFPAAMDSGKTTLVAGLVAAGFSYLTDEAALLDLETLRLEPYAKTLWMAPPSVALFPGLAEKLSPEFSPERRSRTYVSPSDLRPNSISEACPMRYVISPKYVSGTSTELTPISRAEGLKLLVENSFNVERVGAEGVRRLSEAVRDADCYRLRVGDLSSAVAVISGLVAKGATP